MAGKKVEKKVEKKARKRRFTGKRMSMYDLCDKVAVKNDLSHGDAFYFLRDFVRHLRKTFIRMEVGDRVFIKGLGTWGKLQAKERKSRNPQTGATIMVPSRPKIKYSMSADLRNLRRLIATEAEKKAAKGKKKDKKGK